VGRGAPAELQGWAAMSTRITSHDEFGSRSLRRASPRGRRGVGGSGAIASDTVAILMPLYNDWASLEMLLADLDAVLARERVSARVVVVDDGSTLAPSDPNAVRRFQAITRVDVLELRRNLGHQRAIAVGLAYVESKIPCRAVVLMDSDGEDAPSDVPRLLAKLQAEGDNKIVFAERARRSESWLFVLFYSLFKGLHWLLTGTRVRVGNFSVIPRSRLSSLVVVSELWNHYAAAVFNSRQPYCMTPTARARRLAGRSRMNFVRLVVHGMSAISVYSEVIGVRLMVASVAFMGLTVGGLGALIAARFAAHVVIPSWAAVASGAVLLALFQAVMLCATFSFLILGGRQGVSFLPCRDYRFYLGTVRTLYEDR
jgi:hypothetical protein